ncbi:alpha/beta fold hydrolase [Mucilaginibacter psychrotolerans]|uniref:Alpha/beta hydrolase n=1 Tax=Mucilaginibacter psychrotolerans TaxID=1524096 RepID=A0A4Y8SAS6_9SPHI|nr:alpha/beta hydrolase [Mucilaginibacter psychrotolerans]TFF35496.1 alpha/beta hydrolase [Mucilaginibacter psychrotolerans]
METQSFNAQTEFADLGGNKIAYRIFGQGSPLLFYNRFRGILDTWDPLFLDTLAEQHTIVLFDYPGIGDSAGDLPLDITEVAGIGTLLMDHLQIDKFDVAGWSYGGLVAQTALFLNKERIGKAVLIGTNPPGINEVPFDKSFFEKALKPANDLEDEYTLFFEPASEKSRATADLSHERIAKRLDRSKIPSTPEKFQRYFGGSAMIKEDSQNFRGQYQTIQNPVLVISGDHDISFAVENWFPLLRHAPTMQHIILNDSGHGPHHQQPELAAGYINFFLSRP